MRRSWSNKRHPKYQVGDIWEVKETDWLNKGERVTILDVGESQRKKKVYVQKNVQPAQRGWISVKKLRKLVG